MIFLKIAKFDGNYINIPGRYFYCYKLIFDGLSEELANNPFDVFKGIVIKDLETPDTKGKIITVVIINNGLHKEKWDTEFDNKIHTIFISADTLRISTILGLSDKNIMNRVSAYLTSLFTYSLEEDPIIDDEEEILKGISMEFCSHPISDRIIHSVKVAVDSSDLHYSEKVRSMINEKMMEFVKTHTFISAPTVSADGFYLEFEGTLRG